MAIGIGVPLKITIRGTFLGQVFNNVQWYVTDGAAFLTADATGVGEAYWNDIKTLWRAAMENANGLKTTSILVSEPGPTGAFGEYAIPVGEQNGTRAVGSSEFLPSFNAAGIRQVVATRATRPGQKRFVGGLEVDQASGTWAVGYQTLINNLAVKFSEPITLGAPVASGVLAPIVTRIDRATGEVVTWQEVVGFILNTNVTSQVSRKIGRGI